jgi:hypothetical protein
MCFRPYLRSSSALIATRSMYTNGRRLPTSGRPIQRRCRHETHH